MEEQKNKVTSIDGYKESKLVSYIACGATGAGIGEELYDDILHEEVFFKEDETPSNADFCILVNGDSMEPMLKQGTYAFIKKEDSIKMDNCTRCIRWSKSYQACRYMRRLY